MAQHRILLATDGSETSKKAAAFAAEMARAIPGCVITVLTVITVPKSFYSRRLYWAAKNRPGDAEDIKALFEEEAQQVLADTAAIIRQQGVQVATAVREGDPAEEIVAFATEGGYNHIVMGTRGLTDVQGLFVGSVAHKVVHLANVPVTLVK
ncbi:MAG: universal stress protein [Bacillota bacterium]|nr:universal stress protein [Thermoanaerobacteraceae bacterium]